ncbi:KLTH0G09240p [Lachancea thermotolerans CBS 6340]|uniref:KLTH0G09240p n=1 Tax=Lachancea thermotolerans (strain ATCC 56472 / CBS 6340 / NRRL Y-8284) TaxID=559295 RepID=C5DMI6_LACTC|nr:KLTH0G09240p [Lachancea thermotolerans CBS 6340]CAR24997.1 KLTH0G09240p [Lachancea thermotolerans CBS 6340]
MPALFAEAQHLTRNDVLQSIFENNSDQEDALPPTPGYLFFLEDHEDRKTPELYLDLAQQDPVLSDVSFHGEPFLKRFESTMPSNFDSLRWSVDDILADCTPEKSSLWSGAWSDDEALSKDLNSSPFSTPSLTQSNIEDVLARVPEPPIMCFAEFQRHPPQEKPGHIPARASTGKVSKPNNKQASRGKRSSKFNLSAKRALLQKLISRMQMRTRLEQTYEHGILVRRNVAKELAIEGEGATPQLQFCGTRFQDVQTFLQSQATLHQDACHFRTIWSYNREQKGSTIILTLSLTDEQSKCGENEYQFSVISRYLPYDCFGRPHGAVKKKLNRVQEELEREKETRKGDTYCWRHFLTSFEYFKLVSFMLGKEYDFNLNDNQTGETRGSDGKVISPEKRHDMRTRSHAKIYFEGKAVKSAHELLNDETISSHKSFIVGTFGQIMAYTNKRPFGSDSSLSVMEFKYLEEALEKEINFHVFHGV